MTLRRPKPGPPPPTSKSVFYKMREDLKAHVDAVQADEEHSEQETRVPARTQSQIIDDAVELDMVLDRRLLPHLQRLERFADAKELTLRDDLPEVFAQLVELGLEAWDLKQKKK